MIINHEKDNLSNLKFITIASVTAYLVESLKNFKKNFLKMQNCQEN